MTSRPSRLRHLLLITTAVLLMLTEVASAYPRVTMPTERFGYAAQDIAMRLRGLRPPGGNVVIGDNVNLASRLQDETKHLGWPILVSESTYELVKDEFEAAFAAAQALKGKAEPVNIYKVLGRKGAPEHERIHKSAP